MKYSIATGLVALSAFATALPADRVRRQAYGTGSLPPVPTPSGSLPPYPYQTGGVPPNPYIPIPTGGPAPPYPSNTTPSVPTPSSSSTLPPYPYQPGPSSSLPPYPYQPRPTGGIPPYTYQPAPTGVLPPYPYQPGPTGYPPVPIPTGSASCPVDGAVVCNGPNYFGLCNFGSVVWQRVSDGTGCIDGEIVGVGIYAIPTPWPPAPAGTR